LVKIDSELCELRVSAVKSLLPLGCGFAALSSLWLRSAFSNQEVITMGEFLLELWSFMKERKKFWLLPIILCLVLLGSLIVFTSGSAVAPFIYTLF